MSAAAAAAAGASSTPVSDRPTGSLKQSRFTLPTGEQIIEHISDHRGKYSFLLALIAAVGVGAMLYFAKDIYDFVAQNLGATGVGAAATMLFAYAIYKTCTTAHKKKIIFAVAVAALALGLSAYFFADVNNIVGAPQMLAGLAIGGTLVSMVGLNHIRKHVNENIATRSDGYASD